MDNFSNSNFPFNVSIIIVSYNTEPLTRECLKSIFEKTSGVKFEIIVSDNGSTDGTLEMLKNFPQVTVVQNGANVGFGRANNAARKIARGKYVFFLNSDTLLLNNAVKALFDFWESHPRKNEIGAIGGRLFDADMTETLPAGDFPTYSEICILNVRFFILNTVKMFLQIFHLQWIYFARRERILKKRKIQAAKKNFKNENGEIEGYVSGADLFMLNNDDANFDEHFFMYYEETDMELRLARHEKKRFIVDAAKIQHLQSAHVPSKKNFVVTFQQIANQDSQIHYAKKNFGGRARILRILIYLDRLNPFVRKMRKRVPCFLEK